MIDTIKLAIPISKTQHAKLHKILVQNDNWQWIKINTSSGEMQFFRAKGLAQTDQNSYHREIKFDVDLNYRPDDTYLTFEFSIPKYWIGHNVHLVYDWLAPLEHFRSLLQKQLHCRFVDLSLWKVRRVDFCYAWKLPTQDYAKQILNSLKGLKFPYKQPIIYPDAILFAGQTYSVKFYLKLPEFQKHDLKSMVKANYRLEWINWIEERADGVLRYEATLRRKFLKRNNIDTVQDLKSQKTQLVWNAKFRQLNEHINEKDDDLRLACIMMITNYHLYKLGKIKDEGSINANTDNQTLLIPNKVYEAPPMRFIADNGKEYTHKGGGFIVKRVKLSDNILNLFLDKCIGKNRAMDDADLIFLKLKEKYKRNKAAHLMGFWLFVERHGMAEAQENYGKTAYYDARKAIYDAGCNFATPPMVSEFDATKLQKFVLELNSPYVVNRADDERDSGNLLNLISAFEE